MSVKILEKAWTKEQSRMSRADTYLERLKNDDSKLINIDSRLSRKEAIYQLKIWSAQRLHELKKESLNKIPKLEVSDNRQRKLLRKIEWKNNDQDDFPQIITAKSLDKWFKTWLFKLQESHLTLETVKQKCLRSWSKMWLEQVQKKIIHQKEMAAKLVRKLVKYRNSKTSSKGLLHFDAKGIDNKAIAGCPPLEKTIVNPVDGSVEFVKHAARVLGTNYELLRNMSKNKTVSIFGWPAKLVLGLIYKTVNSEQFRNEGYFEFVLRPFENKKQKYSCKYDILLDAKPTEDQPGNARITLSVSEKIGYQIGYMNILETRTYERVAIDLQTYGITGPKLATGLCALFRSCGDKSIKQHVIHHLYFLLLFEIGRRMVTGFRKSFMANEYDNLPIAMTIAKLIGLFQCGIISPNEVFRSGSSYNIFKGPPQERQWRMYSIDKLYKQSHGKCSKFDNCIEVLEQLFN